MEIMRRKHSPYLTKFKNKKGNKKMNFKIQKMIEELTPGVYQTQQHKDYDDLIKRLQEAFNYLNKFEKTKDEFEKISMQSGVEAANKLIADAPKEFKRMTDEVISIEKAKRLSEAKAKKEVLKMFDKLQIKKKTDDLIKSVNELRELERKNNIQILNRYFTDTIRSLDASNIKYGDA